MRTSGPRATRRRADLLAGVTTAAVVVPQSMAHASLAGLPVEAGLYTALVPMLAYAALGTSRPLSVSTTSTIAALTGAAVAAVRPEDAAEALTAASTLALLAGLLLLVGGVLRLGFLADFISVPVLTGFKIGTGVVIIAGQLGKVLGVPVEGEHALAQIRSALASLGSADGTTVAVAGASGVALVLVRRYAGPRVPGPLLVVAAGITVTAAAGLADRGLDVVGAIPAGLPDLDLPDLGLLEGLLPAAAGIALIAFVESVSAARAFAGRDGPDLDVDRELFALGGANGLGSLFQALPAGGGLSQTAVNRGSGARSKAAGAATATVVGLVLVLLTGLFEDLPQAVLGAILIVAAAGLVDVGAVRTLAASRHSEAALAVVTLSAVILLGVLPGVLVGVLTSLLKMVHAANHPPIEVLEREHGAGRWESTAGDHRSSAPPVLVLRLVGALHFANAQRVGRRLAGLASSPGDTVEVVVLDLSAVPDVDLTALGVLADLAEALEADGTALRLAGPHQRPAVLLRGHRGAAPLARRTFPSIDDALQG